MAAGQDSIYKTLGALEEGYRLLQVRLEEMEDQCKEREAELERQIAEQIASVSRRVTTIEKWKAACNLTAVGWGSVCTAATVTGAAIYNWWEAIWSVISRLKS